MDKNIPFSLILKIIRFRIKDDLQEQKKMVMKQFNPYA